MDYPDHEIYNQLYAKYLDRRPASKLVDLAGDLDEKIVIDLCGGAGEIAALSAQRGAAYVELVDECHKMIKHTSMWTVGVEVRVDSVRSALELMRCSLPKVDVAFCRQAVNYWLNETTVFLLSQVIQSGGLFIFNTFNQKPSSGIVLKKYFHDGYEFMEIHQMVDDMVHHVQVRAGLPPHSTSFKWISRDRFHELLSPHFEIEEMVDCNTSIYICKNH